MATASVLAKTLARFASLAGEWVVRGLVAAIAVLAIAMCGIYWPKAPWRCSAGIVIGLYFAIGMIRPSWNEAGFRWLGRTLGRPYRALGGAEIEKHFDTSANFIEAGIEWIIMLIGKLIKWSLLIALSIVGIALILWTFFALFQGVAKLPVSVAVIIGACIIAAALAAKRR